MNRDFIKFLDDIHPFFMTFADFQSLHNNKKSFYAFFMIIRFGILMKLDELAFSNKNVI